MEATQYSIKFLIICTIAFVYNTQIYTTTNGQKITRLEKAQIEAWIKKNKLNAYGDPPTTIYTSNNLFGTGNKYIYIINKHKNKPWSTIKVTLPAISQGTKRKIEAWLKKEKRNIYGDPEGTIYQIGYNPLRQPGGKIITPAELIMQKYTNTTIKPWNIKKINSGKSS